MKNEAPIQITLSLTPAAHGLLVAMATSEGHPSVQACILAELADEVNEWVETVTVDSMFRVPEVNEPQGTPA